MELLTGETLAERLQRGPLSVEQTLDVGVQIASALETSHRAGLVHRDLKPANVMLTPSGVKLLDFGIARFASLGSPALRDTVTATVATHDAHSGTLQYMSPEQLEGKEADARSDIFSFGALLYEMVTGLRAFAGDTPARVTAAILTDDPPSVSSLQSAGHRELDRLIRSCLAKNPDERWQSAHDLRLELGWLTDRTREPPGHSANRSAHAASGSPPPQSGPGRRVAHRATAAAEHREPKCGARDDPSTAGQSVHASRHSGRPRRSVPRRPPAGVRGIGSRRPPATVDPVREFSGRATSRGHGQRGFSFLVARRGTAWLLRRGEAQKDRDRHGHSHAFCLSDRHRRHLESRWNYCLRAQWQLWARARVCPWRCTDPVDYIGQAASRSHTPLAGVST